MKKIISIILFVILCVLLYIFYSKEKFTGGGAPTDVVQFNSGVSIAETLESPCEIQNKYVNYYYFKLDERDEYLKITYDLENLASTGSTADELTNDNYFGIKYINPDTVNDLIEFDTNSIRHCLVKTPQANKVIYNDVERTLPPGDYLDNIQSIISAVNSTINIRNVRIISTNKISKVFCIQPHNSTNIDAENNHYLTYDYTNDRLIKSEKLNTDSFTPSYLFKLKENGNGETVTYSICPLLKSDEFITASNTPALFSRNQDFNTNFTVSCLDLIYNGELNGEITINLTSQYGTSVRYFIRVEGSNLQIRNQTGVRLFYLMTTQNLEYEIYNNNLVIKSNNVRLLVLRINPNEDLGDNHSIEQLYPLKADGIQQQTTSATEVIVEEEDRTENNEPTVPALRSCFYTPRGNSQISCVQRCYQGSEWNNCNVDECISKCLSCNDPNNCRWINKRSVDGERCSHQPFGADLEDCKTQCVALDSNCSSRKCAELCSNCDNPTLCKWKTRTNIHITGQKKPSRPSIRVIGKNNGINVIWSKGDELFPIRKYIVLAKEEGNQNLGMRIEVANNPSCQECIHSIDNLKNNVNYSINVIAVNSHGKSEPSNTVVAHPVELPRGVESMYRDNTRASIIKNVGNNPALVDNIINNIIGGNNDNNEELLQQIKDTRNNQDLISNLRHSSEEREWIRNLKNKELDISIF